MDEKYKKPILTVVIAVLIIGSIAVLESRKVETGRGAPVEGEEVVIVDGGERVQEKAKKYEPAKEISTPDAFINVDDISVSELIGKKVILVDFWTYSCINCQRTLPYLNAWHEKYSDDGLVIIGVHTPEFEFEKELENVKRAVEKFGVKYAVVLDNDYSTWQAYRNQYWPRKYLIDIDGFIVYDHIGEGGYEETEKKIVELLNERSRLLSKAEVLLDKSEAEGVDEVDFSQVRSPEMYFGYNRVENLANLSSTDCFENVCEFVTPDTIQPNAFILGGMWRIGEEEATLESDTGVIAVSFSANKVNLVAGSDVPVRAEIYLDGEKVGEAGGADVLGGVVTFSTHGLYNLIDLGGNYGEHILEIRFLEGGVSAFAFTFG